MVSALKTLGHGILSTIEFSRNRWVKCPPGRCTNLNVSSRLFFSVGAGMTRGEGSYLKKKGKNLAAHEGHRQTCRSA